MHSPEMSWKDDPPTRGRAVVRIEAVRCHDDGIKGVLGQGERPKSTDVLTMLPSGSMCVFGVMKMVLLVLSRWEFW